MNICTDIKGLNVKRKLSQNTCLNGYMNLWVEAPHGEPPPCHVWWPLG